MLVLFAGVHSLKITPPAFGIAATGVQSIAVPGTPADSHFDGPTGNIQEKSCFLIAETFVGSSTFPQVECLAGLQRHADRAVLVPNPEPANADRMVAIVVNLCGHVRISNCRRHQETVQTAAGQYRHLKGYSQIIQ